VICRELYRGIVVWNKTKKHVWGQKRVSDRSEAEWLRQYVPSLRIVDDSLWAAVQDRLDGVRSRLGTQGRRRRDTDSRYLLAGFARCAICGGSFCAMTRNHGAERASFYGCTANHKRVLPFATTIW
jgi:site-specific DNA recombinase